MKRSGKLLNKGGGGAADPLRTRGKLEKLEDWDYHDYRDYLEKRENPEKREKLD